MTKTFGENSFHVHWHLAGRKYHLKVDGISGVSAEHESFAEAEELVVDRLHDRFGELGIQLVFDPPKPMVPKGQCSDSGWEILVPNEFFGLIEPVESLFSQGRCRLCRLGVGSRTESVITLPKQPPKAVHIGYVAGGYPVPLISKEFLNLFSQSELGSLELRKCRAVGRRSSREFYELLPGKLLSCVDVASLSDMSSWKCDACGRVQVDQYLGGSFRFVVLDGTLPTQDQLALIGFPFDYDLAMPRHLWKRISQAQQARRISTEPVAKVASECSTRGFRKMLSDHWKIVP